jgi:ribosome-binding factor A
MGKFSSSAQKGPSQRQLRVGEEIRHALSDIFMRSEVNDPDLDGKSITVSEVRISPDLKNATAFVMPLGGADKEKIMEALGRSSQYLRKLVTDRIILRFSPRIHFKLDYSYEEAAKIDALLRNPRVAQDLGDTSDE